MLESCVLQDEFSQNWNYYRGNEQIKDYPVKYHLVPIVLLLSASIGGSSSLNAEESALPKPHPFGKREHVVQHINGSNAPHRCNAFGELQLHTRGVAT
ncbi:MAG: hypothetical protein CMJ64_26345 [Planctomycetaceae bacterium]|nr:hypothetical protein [Planctomycetaceae bacterium]